MGMMMGRIQDTNQGNAEQTKLKAKTVNFQWLGIN